MQHTQSHVSTGTPLATVSRLTTSQVENALHCKRATVWRMRKSGRLSAPVKVGRQALWLESEIAEILAGER